MSRLSLALLLPNRFASINLAKIGRFHLPQKDIARYSSQFQISHCECILRSCRGNSSHNNILRSPYLLAPFHTFTILSACFVPQENDRQ
jgi:hypothetical protein